MSKNMLGVALRDVRGLLGDLMEKLCGESSEMWLYAFKRFLRREDPWDVIRLCVANTFEILVDETSSLKDQIKKANFGYVGKRISAKYFQPVTHPCICQRKVTLIYFGSNEYMSDGAVLGAIDRAGYRPATIFELLALVTTHPDLETKFEIVALGSVFIVDGSEHVPFIRVGRSVRALDSHWLVDRLGPESRFLVVLKGK